MLFLAYFIQVEKSSIKNSLLYLFIGFFDLTLYSQIETETGSARE